jgi:hypothetical protein
MIEKGVMQKGHESNHQLPWCVKLLCQYRDKVNDHRGRHSNTLVFVHAKWDFGSGLRQNGIDSFDVV